MDRGSITGTFFWTPPSGSIPPVTITVSSTVSEAPIVPPTRVIETKTALVSKEPVVEVTPLVPPQEVDRATQTTGNGTPVTSTPGVAQIQAQPVTPTPGVAQAQTQSSVPVLVPPTITGSVLTIMNGFQSSTWETSVVRTSQGSGVSTAALSVTPPTGSVVVTPQPASTGASHAGLTKGVIISISSGGVALIAAFIGLVFCIRKRRKKAMLKRSGMDIRGKISHPVQPAPIKRLSQDSQDISTSAASSTKRFSQDSKIVLLARSASAASSLKSNNLDRGSPQRPDSYTSVFSNFPITPTSQFAAPAPAHAHARAPVMETPPVAFNGALLVPPATRGHQEVSSYYGSNLHGRDTVGDFSGTVRRSDFGDFNPYLPYQVTQDMSQIQPGGQYHSLHGDIEAPYRDHQSTNIHTSRNLLGGNRRSSLISNQRFNMESRTVADSERSNRDSEWQFDVQAGAENLRTDAPTHLGQGITGRAHQSTYPISLLSGYGNLDGIGGNAERTTGNMRARAGNAGNGNGVGETWEEQRRRIFEERGR